MAKSQNPLIPSVYGIGYLGIGQYTSCIDGSPTKEYRLWKDMLTRCYCPKFQTRMPSYQGCSVTPEWHNFQRFAEWCNAQIGFTNEGWHLDKDLLVKNNKIYSPTNCVFIPPVLNAFSVKANKRRGLYPIGISKHTDTYKGVLGKSRFIVRLSFGDSDGKHLGSFPTIEEAFQCYKHHKEQFALTLAKHWSKVVDPRVVEALKNYTVEMDD